MFSYSIYITAFHVILHNKHKQISLYFNETNFPLDLYHSYIKQFKYDNVFGAI